MTLFSRRVPLSLALAGAALLAALLVIPWAVQAQSDPAAPGNLTAEVLDDGISLSWDAPTEQAGAVTGYQVLRRRPVQGENSLLTLVDDTGSAATGYTDGTAAEAGVRYVYRVKARRGSELSGQSNYVNVQRPEEDPPPASTPEPTPAIPAKSTGLAVESYAHDSVTLAWDDPGDDSILRYEVLRRLRGDHQIFAFIVGRPGPDRTEYRDEGLAAETGYTYQVRAVSANGPGPVSEDVNVETPVQSALSKPAGLSPSVVSHDLVTFTWADPDDPVLTHYEILRREGSSGPFTAIEENTGSTDAAYTDRTVSADTEYEYRVVSVNGEVRSPESDSLSVRTLIAPGSTPTTPASPTGLRVDSYTHDSVTLAWDEPEDDSITGYRVLRRDIVNQPPGTFSAVASNTGTAATTYTDSAVEPETRYAYRVKAINPGGTSDQSNYVDVETPEEPAQPVPAQPTGLSAASVTHDNVTLAWDDPEDDSITGYRILRRARDGKKYGDNKGPKKLSVLADDTATSDTTYTDTSVTARTRYEYAVKARSSSDLSEASTTVAVEALAESFLRQVGTPSEDDATLSRITVDGSAVPRFSPDHYSYEYGVASATTAVTVAATPTNSGARAAITPADSDNVTAGHQVDLSAGRNAVNIRVTAADGNTTQDYTLNVNRGVTDAFGWKAVDDFERLDVAGNEENTGIWSNGTTMWVADVGNRKIYAYRVSDKARDSDNDFDTLDVAGNDDSTGIWSNDVTMWVADVQDGKIYAYRMSDKARDSDNDFDTLYDAENDNPEGIWSNGTTMWVADVGNRKIYAYRMSDKARDSDNDFDTLSAAGNGHPEGIWSNGTTMWVSGPDVDKIYSYNNYQSEPPVFTSAPDGNVDENRPAGAIISTVSATDPEGFTDQLVFTIDAASDAFFRIVPSGPAGTATIRSRVPLDFETAPSHRVTVTATDPDGVPASATITVTVNNINEPGAVSLAPLSGITGQPITATVEDPDGGVAGQSWQWFRGDSSSGPWIPIAGETSDAYTPMDTDAGKYLQVVATYRDTLGGGRTAEAVTAYPVSVAVCADADSVNSCGLGNPAHLEVGAPVLATIDSRHDKDWFRFVMEPGKAYRIDMLGAETGDGTLMDPYLAGLKAVYNVDDNQTDDPDDDVYVYLPDGLRDSEGDRFTHIWREWQNDMAHLGGTYYNDDGGQGYNARMFHRAHPSALLGTPQGYPAGVYYVEARGVGYFPTGIYGMTLTEVTDDSTTPRLLTIGTPVPGTIDYPGDRDQFSINLTANERLLFNASGYGTVASAQLMESMEPQQDIESNQITPSLYHFTPPSTGQYLITVRGYEASRQRHGAGPYTLGAARDPEGQTLLADGSATNTSIGFTGDVDRFKVELDHGVDESKTFRIDVKGLDSGDGTLPNPRIRVSREGGGVPRIYNDDGGVGRNARAYVTVDSVDRLPGDYFIEVNGKDRPGGTYALTVAEVPTGHVWGSVMDPEETQSGPTGFCAPIINGWCAVKQSGQRYGHLRDREFTIGTETYEVLSIRYEPDPSDPKLHLTLDKTLPSGDLGDLVFTVEGVDYPFSSATEGGSTDTGQNHYWSDVSTPPWTVSNFFSSNILVEINRTP